MSEALATLLGLIDRGQVEFVPGYENLPETKRPIRLTDEGHLVRARGELKRNGPMSVEQLFRGADDLPQGGPEAFLRRMVETNRLAAYPHPMACVVSLLDDDRRWREPS